MQRAMPPSLLEPARSEGIDVDLLSNYMKQLCGMCVYLVWAWSLVGLLAFIVVSVSLYCYTQIQIMVRELTIHESLRPAPPSPLYSHHVPTQCCLDGRGRVR